MTDVGLDINRGLTQTPESRVRFHRYLCLQHALYFCSLLFERTFKLSEHLTVITWVEKPV